MSEITNFRAPPSKLKLARGLQTKGVGAQAIGDDLVPPPAVVAGRGASLERAQHPPNAEPAHFLRHASPSPRTEAPDIDPDAAGDWFPSLPPLTFRRGTVPAGVRVLPRSVYLVRLLLLDSDANFRKALAIALRLDGVTVHEAEDLPTVERLLEAHAFDAIVLHLTQPGVPMDFIARLQDQNPRCRVVVCNAHQEVLDAMRAGLPRPVLELRRPFRAEELLARLGFPLLQPAD